MATGRYDMKNYALPSYWDAAELEKWRLADGTTYDQVVADIGRALAIQNAALLQDPLMAALCSITTDDAIEVEVGASNGFQAHTEYARPDQKRGATTGWMLPLNSWDRGLGWTWDFLRRARRSQLDANIASAMRDLKNIFEQQVLTRVFKETYTAVGSAGRSMPLADAGTADANYVPIQVPERAAAFTSSHDHIAPTTSATITQALFQTQVQNLWEHGYDAPYDLVISSADIAGWTNTTNVTGWTTKAEPTIQFGLAVDIANVDSGCVGAIQTDFGAVRVRVSGRIPTLYWTVFKSFGPNDARNPVRIRYNEQFGMGAILMKGDHIREYPLEDAILFFEFGVGIGNRVGAVAAENTASSYSDPTIT